LHPIIVIFKSSYFTR